MTSCDIIVTATKKLLLPMKSKPYRRVSAFCQCMPVSLILLMSVTSPYVYVHMCESDLAVIDSYRHDMDPVWLVKQTTQLLYGSCT